MRRAPPLEAFSMSFIDLFSCAFGGMMLLMILFSLEQQRTAAERGHASIYFRAGKSISPGQKMTIYAPDGETHTIALTTRQNGLIAGDLFLTNAGAGNWLVKIPNAPGGPVVELEKHERLHVLLERHCELFQKHSSNGQSTQESLRDVLAHIREFGNGIVIKAALSKEESIKLRKTVSSIRTRLQHIVSTSYSETLSESFFLVLLQLSYLCDAWQPVAWAAAQEPEGWKDVLAEIEEAIKSHSAYCNPFFKSLRGKEASSQWKLLASWTLRVHDRPVEVLSLIGHTGASWPLVAVWIDFRTGKKTINDVKEAYKATFNEAGWKVDSNALWLTVPDDVPNTSQIKEAFQPNRSMLVVELRGLRFVYRPKNDAAYSFQIPTTDARDL